MDVFWKIPKYHVPYRRDVASAPTCQHKLNYTQWKLRQLASILVSRIIIYV
jgi:hypothetical protein